MNYLFLMAILPPALLAQTLGGTWQGSLTPPNQNQEIRIAFKIAHNGNAYQGRFYNLDASRQFNLGTITLEGNAVKIAIPGNGSNYDGKIGPDGNSIAGTLTMGTNAMPLALKRAIPETAWELPPPPAAPKGLPAGAKLEFEVATIKPAPAGQQGQGFNVTATQLLARNSSLADVLAFAHMLHRKQIAGLPAWADTERYDIVASLPQGDPTDPQLRTMLKNLMKSRFNLAFHTDKRELPVYTINIGKGGMAGLKLVKNDTSGMGVSAQGLGRLSFRGTTMANLANTLQIRVLDRPVIDQSGLTDRFDFTLNWTPDEFQFPGIPAARRAAIPASPETFPDLFTAFRDQLGLRLEAAKASAEMLVIDSVAKPSEN